MIRQLGSTAATTLTGLAQDTITYSADLLAYVIPSPFHPWWGAGAAAILRPFPGTLIEKVMFPTYTALLLAALGWAVGRRRGWPVGFWAAMAGVFCVLSLGPVLHVAGQQLPVPLPAVLLYQLPVANLTRAPGRFVVLVLLALAVLGLRPGRAVAGVRGGGLGAGPRGSGTGGRRCGVEGTIPKSKIQNPKSPVPSPPTPSPSSPYSLCSRWGWSCGRPRTGWRCGMCRRRRRPSAGERRGAPCLTCRCARSESSYMQAQIVHQHPLIGGYLARAPAYPLFDGVPAFTEFKMLQAAPDLCVPPLNGLGPGVLATFGTGTVVCARGSAGRPGVDGARDLAGLLGLGAPALEDDRLVIYRPPAPARLPLVGQPQHEHLVRPGRSGRCPLPLDGCERHDSRLAGGGRPGHAATARLQLRHARRFAVTVDGTPGPVVTLGPAPEPLDIPLPTPAGHTVITLQALNPPSRPAGTGAGADPRLLSLGLVECALTLGR